jgi:hypothetical protein
MILVLLAVCLRVGDLEDLTLNNQEFGETLGRDLESGSTVRLTDCWFSHITTDVNGSALYLRDVSSVTLSGCQFEWLPSDMGCLYVNTVETLAMEDCSLIGVPLWFVAVVFLRVVLVEVR